MLNILDALGGASDERERADDYDFVPLMDWDKVLQDEREDRPMQHSAEIAEVRLEQVAKALAVDA